MNPEGEFGGPPDAAEWHPPVEGEETPLQEEGQDTSERPHIEEVSKETPGVSGPETNEEPESAEPKAGQGSAEEDAEDKEAAEQFEAKVRAGLATLHSLLQLDPDIRQGNVPKEKQFNDLLDASGVLTELFPAPRRELYSALRHDRDFRTADLPDFTRRATGILSLWIHAEGMKIALDRSLEKKSAARQQGISTAFEQTQDPPVDESGTPGAEERLPKEG